MTSGILFKFDGETYFMSKRCFLGRETLDDDAFSRANAGDGFRNNDDIIQTPESFVTSQ